jgi:hypothetical protein
MTHHHDCAPTDAPDEDDVITTTRDTIDRVRHQGHIDGAVMERARIIAVLATELPEHMLPLLISAIAPDLEEWL